MTLAADGTVSSALLLRLAFLIPALILLVVSCHILGMYAVQRFRKDSGSGWIGDYARVVTEGCSFRVLIAMLIASIVLIAIGAFALPPA